MKYKSKINKLGIDFDETLFETLENLCKYKNKKNNENWEPSMFKSYKWYKTIGGTFESSIKLFHEFCNSDFYFKTRVVNNAPKYLSLLNKKYKLYVISYRSSFLKEKTIRLAENYFGSIFEEFFLPGDHNNDTPYNTKLDVCLDNNIETLIDDNVDFVKECIEHGIKIILLNKPWNQGFDDSKYNNVIRVKEWKEIYHLLK